MTLLQWVSGENVKRRLAELIAVNNGSMEVVGEIGKVVACTVNRYGRIGLTIHEAFELTYLRGMWDALAIGLPGGVIGEARDVIGREIQGITIAIARPDQVKEILCK